jgi:hypothetical protein
MSCSQADHTHTKSTLHPRGHAQQHGPIVRFAHIQFKFSEEIQRELEYNSSPQCALRFPWPRTALNRAHSTAQHSTAQHSTAQHSTAQHSTAQHSTAQHSTAGLSPTLAADCRY